MSSVVRMLAVAAGDVVTVVFDKAKCQQSHLFHFLGDGCQDGGSESIRMDLSSPFSLMTKPKRKLTPAEKAAKRKRQQEFMTVFVNGKMKRVRRPPMIEGMPVEEFIRRNADSIWLLQEGRWEDIENE